MIITKERVFEHDTRNLLECLSGAQFRLSDPALREFYFLCKNKNISDEQSWQKYVESTKIFIDKYDQSQPGLGIALRMIEASYLLLFNYKPATISNFNPSIAALHSKSFDFDFKAVREFINIEETDLFIRIHEGYFYLIFNNIFRDATTHSQGGTVSWEKCSEDGVDFVQMNVITPGVLNDEQLQKIGKVPYTSRNGLVHGFGKISATELVEKSWHDIGKLPPMEPKWSNITANNDPFVLWQAPFPNV